MANFQPPEVSTPLKVPEVRETILLNGQERDLLDLSTISDNIDLEMKQISHTYHTLHEILVSIDETIARLQTSKKLKEAAIREPLVMRKQTDKSLTVDVINSRVETNMGVIEISEEIKKWQIRAERIRGALTSLSMKHQMLMILGSRRSYEMQSTNSVIKDGRHV